MMFNHKIIFSISVLASVMALSACQPKQPEPKEKPAVQQVKVQPEILKLTGNVEKLTLDLPQCEGNRCPEISIERLSSNQAFIDEWMDQHILKQFVQILDISPVLDRSPKLQAADPSKTETEQAASTAVVETPKQKLEQQMTPYSVTFLALDKELKDLSANHQISVMITPKIVNTDLPLATVVLNSSSYLGGAHGSSSQHYYNFDLKQKKHIELDDILLANQKPILEKKAHDVFKTWVMDSKLANSVEEYEQAWQFTLSDNFYLSPKGLILQYDAYEIGPYVVGLPQLTIPYDQLQTVLKKAYLPQTEQNAASTAHSKK